ncbi:arginine decarboxylase [Geoalkalibacter ferrihydriticus]|uniref:Arginine decarboxylase n=2 Tax=Geoalkalibacter ferrihydriticus TaxID=392333 RepID=A0A0C2HLB7_9BACT|nr:biosynthetic arginine decarboxylase [Geoalkalibacter ferrihydriticus]KIH77871.1 arginine decarboxylase [Geoalkalibacter ferrihydriticus DSM 17813]SDL83618.1 arginine decarboxylase [Geoalkalibacter ferrihydriticus]
MTPKTAPSWTHEDSARLYRIHDWSAGYFDVTEKGDVAVKVAFPSGDVRVSLMDIVAGVNQRDLQMPVLLRIENLLDSQIALLNESFRAAIAQQGYRGIYQGVFPIKVNQQRNVIEEIARFGARYNHGLEAGSKAELIVALSALAGSEGLIVCNGYKDPEFIDLGLRARKLGYRCVFVIETPTELPIILERSHALGIRPLIGVRAKLATTVGGHWNKTSGDRSIFGLSTSQLIEIVDALKEHNLLDCLQLLHCHLGSQIPNIRDIRQAVMEACRYYINLVQEGAPMGFLDLGGGLAVDYLGSKTNNVLSMNYSMDEYCADVVEVIMQSLDAQEVAHPTIVTESGRSTVAYYSLLLFNIFDVTYFEPAPLEQAPAEEEHTLVHSLYSVLERFKPAKIQQSYNNTVFYRDEIRELFKRGQISLRSRALAENLVLEIFRRIVVSLEDADEMPPELEGLREQLADIYYGNLSIFQSLPDAWAIDQVFPVMPIHRLNERPTREAIIADITCDSDGRIDHFIDLHGTRNTLPLHPIKADEDYYLGAFLVGAYQETLGDLHNLFGDTNVVSIRVNEDGSFDVTREIQGDSIADILGYVQYNPKDIFERFRDTAEKAVRRGAISVRERQEILERFSASLRGYTYYETDA